MPGSGKTLFSHQVEAVFSLFKECERARALQLAGTGERLPPCAVQQPTAAGKSIEFFRLALEVFEAWGWRTLIICPGTTLVGQLRKNAQKELGPGWRVGQIGDGVEDYEGCHVVIAVAAALYSTDRRSAERFRRVLAEGYELVVFDECHHVAADNWMRVFRAVRETAQLVCGFTATTVRGDGKNICGADYFTRLVCVHTPDQLLAMGRIRPCYPRVVHTGVSIQRLGLRDYDPEDLERQVNTDELNLLTVNTWKKFGEGKKTIVFCVSIEHARRMAEMFTREGVPAQAVWGKGSRKGKDGKVAQAGMPKKARDKILEDFEHGETQVITNVYVLSEGVDIPAVGCVVFCRPTTKELGAVFFPQGVGRARRLGSDPYSIIIELTFDETAAPEDGTVRKRAEDVLGKGEAEGGEDAQPEPPKKKTRSLIAEALGVEVDDLDTTGMLSLEEQEKQLKQKQRERERGQLRLALQQLESTEQIDAQFDILERMSYMSAYAWLPLGDNSFLMMLGGDGDFVEVVRESANRWDVLVSLGGHLERKGYAPTKEDALRFADEWLDMLDMNRYLIDRSQPWRTQNPTPAQLSRARKYGLNVEVLAKLKRGRVSDILTSVRALEKHGERQLSFDSVLGGEEEAVVYDI